MKKLKTHEKKSVQSRQHLEWHLAYLYFETFHSTVTGKIANDQKFQNMYNNFLDYISDKIKPAYEGEITNTFVIVEQEIPEK